MSESRHIRRVRLVLPHRMGKIAPHAARELASRMIDAAYDAPGGLETLERRIGLQDRGQTAAQFGLEAARTAKSKPDGGRS